MPTPRRRHAIVLIAAATTLFAGFAGVLPATATSAAEPATDPVALPETAGRLDAGALDAARALAAGAAGPEEAAAGTTRSGTLAESLRGASGPQSVFVEFAGPTAGDVAASGGRAGAPAAVEARTAEIEAAADDVADSARAEDAGTDRLFTTTNALAGVGLTVDASVLPALAARDDVIAVSPLVPKRPATAGAAQLSDVLTTWQNTGRTGAGVSIGVIDTGIDYTHAAFGGPGTVEAFEAARDSDTWTPSGAVVGGYDFVGDDYDGSNDVQPDQNPMDCEGHGTHVAGIAAGRGVETDGSTFSGDYASLTGEDLYDLRIGPGMAPQASLYALRVFGCTGESNVLLPALDWALDPNGDGDFGDHLDIVNLSLGSDWGAADDPDSRAVDKLAAHGVLAVVSAGNSGDLTDVGGSPASAVTSLAVAASVDEYQLLDGLRVDGPGELAGEVPGQVSQYFDWAGAEDVSGGVVTLPGSNADGCEPIDPAAVAGRIVWLEWDGDERARRCGSVARGTNVADAGASGFILTSDTDHLTLLIAGSEEIPGFQLTATATDRLRASAEAGTLQVTFSDSLRSTIGTVDPSLNDTLSASSSRGTRIPGVIKPDIAAPGDTIASAGMGTGSGAQVESGTSMATPAVAGIAALVKQTHPDWGPERIKSAVMNAARGEVTTETDGQGERFGPARVGAGPVDAATAVGLTSLAYNGDTEGAVSVSFGLINPTVRGGTVTGSSQLVIENLGATARTYQLGYDEITSQPGVSYTVRPTKVTVPAGQQAEVTVRVSVNPFTLRHTIESSMDAEQGNLLLIDEEGNPELMERPFLPSASGRVLVTSGSEQLRVPVYTTAKPASSTTTSLRVDGKGRMTLAGAGNGVESGVGDPNRYQSQLSVLTLGAESPELPVCTIAELAGCVPYPSAGGTDLRYVGAGSTPAEDGSRVLWFGLASWAPWTSVSETSMLPAITIDTTGDGLADFFVEVIALPGSDFRYALVYDLVEGELVGAEPLNFDPSDSRTFDNDVLLVPVSTDALGLDPAATSLPISYTVLSSGSAADPFLRDVVGPVEYDVAAPPLAVAGPLFPDTGGTRIPVQVNGSGPVSALVLHLDNQAGQRAEVVPIAP